MSIDGRQIASAILSEVKESVRMAERMPVVRAITLRPSPATESYLAIKRERAAEAGMHLEIVRLADDADEQAVIDAVRKEGADSVIVQLPLPDTIDTTRVLDAIPVALDADVLSTAARDAFTRGDAEALLPPVVASVREILERNTITLSGKRAVVIGSGWLVGAPAATWLTAQGAHVEVLTRESADYGKLREADIVVSGAGSPGLIQPAMLKEGVVLIDAGTSESGGAIVGDADPACADVASLFTPVPGGVGPIAVACLFQNAARLALRPREKAL